MRAVARRCWTCPGRPILEDLSRSNLLLVPLDRRGEWYRYHHLFRDMLLAELARLEPGMAPVLRRRAANWCLRNGLPEERWSTPSRQRMPIPPPTCSNCRTHLLSRSTHMPRRWLQWLEDRGGIKQHPMVAVQAAFISAVLGRPVEAERWAVMVERWQSEDAFGPEDPATKAWTAFVRALLCRHGVEQMRADANEAVHRFAAENIVQPEPLICQGLARVLSGDPDGADQSFADAVSVGEQVGAYEALAVALCERSLLAMARNQWTQAEALASQASAVGRPSGWRNRWPARCWPARPCTGVTPRRCASSWSPLSGCGLS